MKKATALFILILIVLFCVNVNAQDINIIVSGEELECDVEPFIDENNRILVPFRAIFEKFDAFVEWNVKSKSILCIKDDLTIKLVINNDKMFVNGKEITLDSPAQIVDGRTFVPLRAISECMGADVKWDFNEKTAYIDFANGLFNASNVRLEKMAVINKTVKAKEDVPIFEGQVKYAVISGEAKGIDKINAEIKDTADLIIYMAKDNYGVTEKSLIDRYNETGRYNIMTAEVAVKYADNDFISYISSVKSVVGGINPIETKQGGIFDLNTGKIMGLDKVLENKDEVLAQAEAKFKDLIAKNPELYYKDVEIDIKDTYYYLTEKGIVFGFNKETIAPYSTGFVEVEVDR